MTIERGEAVLAMREQLRQLEGYRVRTSDDEEFRASGMEQLGKRIADVLERILGGLPLVENMEELNFDLDSETFEGAPDDPPSITMMSKILMEAELKGLPMPAQFLAYDAMRAAAAGTSKESWILEVLKGHQLDEVSQIGCMRHIVAIWSEGPWPWPRDLEMRTSERG